jgi:hypothetical protein
VAAAAGDDDHYDLDADSDATAGAGAIGAPPEHQSRPGSPALGCGGVSGVRRTPQLAELRRWLLEVIESGSGSVRIKSPVRDRVGRAEFLNYLQCIVISVISFELYQN